MISSLSLPIAISFYFIKANTLRISSSSLRLSALPSIIAADSGMNHFGFSFYSFPYSRKHLAWVCELCVWCVSVCSHVWIWLHTCLCFCGGQGTSWGVAFHFSLRLKWGFILFAAVYMKLARSGASRHSRLHSPFHWRSAGTRHVYRFQLYVASGDLNSGPYTCPESILPI